MKNKIIPVLFIVFLIIVNALGLWFLMGGDLSELLNGCFDAKGCK